LIELIDSADDGVVELVNAVKGPVIEEVTFRAAP
jgi:hypothetical protein